MTENEISRVILDSAIAFISSWDRVYLKAFMKSFWRMN